MLGAEIWFITFTLFNTLKLGTNLTYGKYLRLMKVMSVGNCAY